MRKENTIIPPTLPINDNIKLLPRAPNVAPAGCFVK